MGSARIRRHVARLALAVMLLGALAPAVSHALAWSRAGAAAPSLLDICMGGKPRVAALGLASIASPVESSAAQPVSGQAPVAFPDHCPFCLLVAERLGPPPAALVHFFHADPALPRPDTQALFIVTLVTSSPLPRGPPHSLPSAP
ncbi:DUF2946 family protein [Rhodoferax sp. BAB1]|uniref:DUF2946 family protein n=1 Tax=Rhodoferax sp. BAB1 TaxID=2741720 RepID=UPI001575EDEE|nr:DUF2946 family protein [Rhodoferax sp. BAB1]